MIKRASRKLKKLNGAVALASALVLLAAPVSSMAAGPFSLDGLNAAPDSYDVSFDAKWTNAHGSTTNYPEWQDGGVGEAAATVVHYGTGTDANDGGTGTIYSWLFIEVPLVAKSMIWDDKDNPTFWTPADTTSYGTILDFDKATGSEKVVFSGAEIDFGANYGKDGTLGGDGSKDPIVTNSWGILDVRDSVDYLVSSSICGTGGDANTSCEQRSQTMSFELKLTALDAGGFDDLKAAIVAGLEFHLSPEGRNDTPDMSEVPVPAAFWLFGTALIGFIGFSRRTNLG